MAVAAINAQPRHVMLMAERDRLGASHPGVRHVWRALELNAGPERERKKEDRAEDGGARDCISTAMENLHRSDFHCSGNSSCSSRVDAA